MKCLIVVRTGHVYRKLESILVKQVFNTFLRFNDMEKVARLATFQRAADVGSQ
jgi:hypothetical protein